MTHDLDFWKKLVTDMVVALGNDPYMASTAMEIGQAFGDKQGANIHALGPDEFELVFCNVKYWK